MARSDSSRDLETLGDAAASTLRDLENFARSTRAAAQEMRSLIPSLTKTFGGQEQTPKISFDFMSSAFDPVIDNLDRILKKVFDDMVAASRRAAELMAKEEEAQAKLKKEREAAFKGLTDNLVGAGSALSDLKGGSLALAKTFTDMKGVMVAAKSAGTLIGEGRKQFMSGDPGMQAAGIANMSVGVMEGALALDAATNVRGRGNRTLRGAMTGAAIGNQIVPGYGALVGAGVGALVGLIRTPDFERVYNEVKEKYDIKLKDETAKAISSIAKDKFHGNRKTAATFALGSIITDAGGVTKDNSEKLVVGMQDAIRNRNNGQFTTGQMQTVLNSNFKAFQDHVLASKDLAGKAFQELITMNGKLGNASSHAIDQFVTAQTTKLGAAVQGIAAPLAKAAQDVTNKIAEAKAKQKEVQEGEGGADEKALAGLGDQVAVLEAQKQKLGESSKAEFERLGVIALGAFNASIAGGQNYVTALAGMEPALNTILTLQTQLGITSENAAVKRMMEVQGLVQNNTELVMSTSALGETIKALSSIGGLTAETLTALKDQGLATFSQLTAEGMFTQNEALAQMGDFLKNLEQGYNALGIPIDETTQGLIDQAKGVDVLKSKNVDATEVMQTGFENVVASLNAIAKGLGVDIPSAADQTTNAIGRIPRHVEIDARLNYSAGDMPSPPGGGDYPGYAHGTGGFRNFGRGTMAMLHGWEAVIPMNQLHGGAGGGQGVEVNVWLNDEIIGRAAARGLPAMLHVYGAAR